MPDRDELQMVQPVREGNHEAFRELVQRHMRQAYNVAFGFLNDHDEADDISQLAFVKVSPENQLQDNLSDVSGVLFIGFE